MLPRVPMSVATPSGSLEEPTVTLQGSASPGSAVSANGVPANVSGASWNVTVPLHLGHNNVTVRVSKAGYRVASRTLRVTRRQSQAEYEATATTIPYADLLKDSGPYVGRVVSFRGQVLQIQQDGNNGGIMLLSVTDDGYGVWTDNVWVDYDHSTPANENDIITVYGTVTGTKSYDTQAGGSTYVPEMHARYIDMTG
jgi:hypothetical protein